MKKTNIVTELLKAWYFIDSVLLNEHAKYCITDSKDYEEYISLKSALLSDLNEFYNYIGYNPENIKIPENDKQLQEMAVQEAKRSKIVSARMIERSDFKSHMKKMILKEFDSNNGKDINDISDTVINERFLKMVLDNVLVGIPVIECKNKEKVSDFKGGILEQAYLTVRSDMISIARKYNPIFQNKSVQEGWGMVGLVSVGGFMLASAIARSIESFSNRCSARCGVLSSYTSYKKVCELKCKIQTQQKIIAALRQSAAQSNNEVARNKFAKDVQRAQLRMAQYQRQLAQITATRSGSEDAEPSERSRLI